MHLGCTSFFANLGDAGLHQHTVAEFSETTGHTQRNVSFTGTHQVKDSALVSAALHEPWCNNRRTMDHELSV